MESVFLKSKEAQNAFEKWTANIGGICYNDIVRADFFKFVAACYKNDEMIDKDCFLKETDKYLVEPKKSCPGIRQRHYQELTAIIQFLKANNIIL